eukprot:TRINITY_DN32797_c0_g1_i1.p1 TRINITY_DN32797_c0_g1~~TRINITY_DN32797_c0_g1_i1.p1  ORF type:complete len:504 (+),score=73.00 TRINITY_DN32797_c0_g1_i1:91-1602(+)
MATADAIRALIEARTQEVARAEGVLLDTQREYGAAVERQRLRRELDALDKRLKNIKTQIEDQKSTNRIIDADFCGPHLPSNPGRAAETALRQLETENSHWVLDCDEAVLDGTIEWTIKGLSWLQTALGQNGERCADSECILVGGHRFHLCYSPTHDEMGAWGQRASLAICHFEEHTSHGVSFRYNLWIKSKERGYVQWGKPAQVYQEEEVDDMLFGPDVCDALAVPQGIFGMTHSQLLNSEWVVNDTLTAKLQIWVRPNVASRESRDTAVLVPPCNHHDKLLRLLESGSNSDVTFIVQGEEVRAHSLILSTFSDVFQAQFASGMQEAASKQVIIEDCDPVIFKAFLRYLYSENFASLEGVIQQAPTQRAVAERHGDSDNARGAGQFDRLTLLRQVLALSHKYQETRLQKWSEQELCKHISIADVCHLLCQAHLYEAKLLESKCLDFLAANKNGVAVGSTFGSLAQDWPEVSLKITLRLARFSEDASAGAMKSHENARKRKRSD